MRTNTAKTDRGQTTYRNAQGQLIMKAAENGNKTIYRNAQGQTTMTAIVNGQTTTYRDRLGKLIAKATENGNTNRDAQGKLLTKSVADSGKQEKSSQKAGK